MRPNSSQRAHVDIPLLILASLVLLGQPSGNAVAGDLLGLYVGGAIGQSRVEATETACQCDLFQEIVTEKFDKTHLAFKGVLGARPISLVGAEIDYIDFGKPGGQAFGFPASWIARTRAAPAVLAPSTSSAHGRCAPSMSDSTPPLRSPACYQPESLGVSSKSLRARRLAQ